MADGERDAIHHAKPGGGDPEPREAIAVRAGVSTGFFLERPSEDGLLLSASCYPGITAVNFR